MLTVFPPDSEAGVLPLRRGSPFKEDSGQEGAIALTSENISKADLASRALVRHPATREHSGAEFANRSEDKCEGQ